MPAKSLPANTRHLEFDDAVEMLRPGVISYLASCVVGSCMTDIVAAYAGNLSKTPSVKPGDHRFPTSFGRFWELICITWGRLNNFTNSIPFLQHPVLSLQLLRLAFSVSPGLLLHHVLHP